MKYLQSPKTSPFLLMILFVFGASTVQAQWGWGKKVNGNGNVTTETRNVADFDELSVSAGITVIYEQGSKSVKVEADENLQEYIITEVKGEKLIVRRKNNTNLKKFKKMTVYVSSPNIYYISSSSGSSFKSTKEISTANLEIDCSSGSSFYADISAKKVDIECSSGSSVTVDVEAEYLKADTSSGSSLNIDGVSNSADLDASSGSSLKAKGLKVKEATADASSAGSISITVDEKLDASASSGASINYYGSPADVDKATSSGGSVSKN